MPISLLFFTPCVNGPGPFGQLCKWGLCPGPCDSAASTSSALCVRQCVWSGWRVGEGNVRRVWGMWGRSLSSSFEGFWRLLHMASGHSHLSCLTSDLCGYCVLFQAGLKSCPKTDRHFFVKGAAIVTLHMHPCLASSLLVMCGRQGCGQQRMRPWCKFAVIMA